MKRAVAVLSCLALGIGAGLFAFALQASGWSFATALGRLAGLRLEAAPQAVADAPVPAAAAPTESAPAAGTPAASAAAATPPPEASASAAPEATAAPVASAAPVATAAPEAPGPDPNADPTTCLQGHFSRDAFVRKAPSLKFVCTTSDAKKLVARLRVAIVDASGGHVSDSMKEWSLLGYYELATIALLRGRCCAEPEALELPPGPSGCAPLVERLTAITSASRPGAPDADLDAALSAFDAAARCVGKSERPTAYGYGLVGSGEASAFDKTRRRPGG